MASNRRSNFKLASDFQARLALRNHRRTRIHGEIGFGIDSRRFPQPRPATDREHGESRKNSVEQTLRPMFYFLGLAYLHRQPECG